MDQYLTNYVTEMTLPHVLLSRAWSNDHDGMNRKHVILTAHVTRSKTRILL